MIALLVLWIDLFVFGIAGDETLAAYAPADRYRLTDLNGAPFEAEAMLDIRTPGQISGTAPCNSYSAAQTAPYPWFAAGPIRATRMACPDLPAEQAYFAALAAMTLAEAAGDILILSNTDGGQMVFQALP